MHSFNIDLRYAFPQSSQRQRDKARRLAISELAKKGQTHPTSTAIQQASLAHLDRMDTGSAAPRVAQAQQRLNKAKTIYIAGELTSEQACSQWIVDVLNSCDKEISSGDGELDDRNKWVMLFLFSMFEKRRRIITGGINPTAICEHVKQIKAHVQQVLGSYAEILQGGPCVDDEKGTAQYSKAHKLAMLIYQSQQIGSVSNEIDAAPSDEELLNALNIQAGLLQRTEIIPGQPSVMGAQDKLRWGSEQKNPQESSDLELESALDFKSMSPNETVRLFGGGSAVDPLRTFLLFFRNAMTVSAPKMSSRSPAMSEEKVMARCRNDVEKLLSAINEQNNCFNQLLLARKSKRPESEQRFLEIQVKNIEKKTSRLFSSLSTFVEENNVGIGDRKCVMMLSSMAAAPRGQGPDDAHIKLGGANYNANPFAFDMLDLFCGLFPNNAAIILTHYSMQAGGRGSSQLPCAKFYPESSKVIHGIFSNGESRLAKEASSFSIGTLTKWVGGILAAPNPAEHGRLGKGNRLLELIMVCEEKSSAGASSPSAGASSLSADASSPSAGADGRKVVFCREFLVGDQLLLLPAGQVDDYGMVSDCTGFRPHIFVRKKAKDENVSLLDERMAAALALLDELPASDELSMDATPGSDSSEPALILALREVIRERERLCSFASSECSSDPIRTFVQHAQTIIGQWDHGTGRATL